MPLQHRLPQQRDVLGADESTRAHEGVHRRANSPDSPDEVERLLAELGQDEASEAVAKTYVLSETGKVYTLLAHAAGKLH